MKNNNMDEQIYKEIYSAEEIILKEANEILNRPDPYDQDRYDRLTKMNELGFANAEQVKEFLEASKKIAEFKKLKNKIEYYRQVYPMHKFISEDAVKAICQKYNLLLAMASDYIAEVPEKNQKEIVAFRIKRKDTRVPLEVNFALMLRREFLIMYAPEVNYEEMVEGKDLLIIAPEHKLKTEGKIKEGHILRSDDPIVLQPVDSGYLIVTSWGLEASDDLVINPIHN